SSAGPTTVNVGNAGRLTDILAAVTIANPPSFTAVNVDDSADPVARTVTQDTVFFRGADNGRISFGGVPIYYKYAYTSALTLRTGTGSTTVNVLATGVSTNLVCPSGFQVSIGSPTAGLDNINGTVNVSGSIVSFGIDDSHTSANHSYVFGRNFVQQADKA